MRIEGKYFKNKETGNFYAVVIDALGINTQGKTFKEALDMAKDAVEMMVENTEFEVNITPGEKRGKFYISSNNSNLLIGLILKAQRIIHGLSVKEIVEILGEQSETGYRRYERGEVSAGLEKLDSIFKAMSIEPCLKIS